MRLWLCIIVSIASICFGGIDRGPLLSSENPSDAMVANFRTDNSCIGELRYRQLPDGAWETVADTLSVTLHALVMPISPFTQNEYYVLADGDSMGPYSYWTAPLPGENVDFNFCAYGDTRTGLIAHYLIIDHIMGCDPMFLLHSGDMIEDGEDNGDWDNYFAELCEWHNIAQSVAYFYAMGNHDDEAPYFYDALTLPKNPVDNSEAFCSYDWGRIHFVTMNSEIDYSLTSDQYEFLSNDLAAASVNPDYDFIIGFVHRPFYSSGYHGREEAMAEVLEPLLVANNVDLVIQGHDHMYERTYPQDGVYYIVTGGGGAPVSPIGFWQDWCAKGYNLYHHLDFHYDASEHKLSMWMHNYSDDIVDSLFLYSTPVGARENPVPEMVGISLYPNPFNSSCHIVIADSELLKARSVTGEIFNLSGHRLEKFTLSNTQNAGFTEGETTAKWSWQPDSDVGSGIYLLRLTVDERVYTQRIIYLR